MLLQAGGAPAAERRRCTLCPLKKRNMCRAYAGLETASDESVILVYWKLRDDVADRGFLRGLPRRLGARLLLRAYRKAAARRGEFDSSVRRCLAELHALEEAKVPSLDRPADTFARILRAAAPETGNAARDRTLGELLYHVGRWIYLLDARDDWAEDVKAGHYNPLALRYPGGVPEDEELRLTVTHSRNLACAAYQLLPPTAFQPVLDNIFYFGLPAVEAAVFSGKWKEIKKLRIRRTVR